MLSIIWSFLPDNDWWALPVFLCKLNPVKAHWRTGSWSFSFERSATFPPQADHVLVDLFSSEADGGALWAKLPHRFTEIFLSFLHMGLPKFKILICQLNAYYYFIRNFSNIIFLVLNPLAPYISLFTNCFKIRRITDLIEWKFQEIKCQDMPQDWMHARYTMCLAFDPGASALELCYRFHQIIE